MHAPDGFNPNASLLEQNATAPIQAFRGGGISAKPFYQAILTALALTALASRARSLPPDATITKYEISVKDGNFVLKLRIKGKKQDTGNGKGKEGEGKGNGTGPKPPPNEIGLEADDEADDDIFRKAREFLIMMEARNFLRNLENDVSSEDGEANDEDRNEPVANNENNTPPLSKANINPIEKSKIPPHLRGVQSTPTPTPNPKSKRSLNEIAAAARVKRPVSLSPTTPSLSLDDQVRAETNAMIAAAEEQQRTLEEAQRVVEEAKRIAETQRGFVESTPRGRRGTQVTFSSTLPPGTDVTATSNNVTEASRVAAQLTGTTSTVPVTGAVTKTLKKIGFGSNPEGKQSEKLNPTQRVEQVKKQRINIAKKDFTSIRNDKSANKTALLERYKGIHKDLLNIPEIKALINQIEALNPPQEP